MVREPTPNTPEGKTSTETQVEEKKPIDEKSFQYLGTTFQSPTDRAESRAAPSAPSAPRRTISDLIHDLTGRYPGLIYVIIGVISFGIAIYSGHLKSLKEFIFVTFATVLLWAALAFFGKR